MIGNWQNYVSFDNDGSWHITCDGVGCTTIVREDTALISTDEESVYCSKACGLSQGDTIPGVLDWDDYAPADVDAP